MMSKLVIGPEKTVTLHFEIRLADGAVVDSNFAAQPVTFTIGDGNMLAGFESAMFGLTAGERRIFELKPEQAFGMPNPGNIQTLARADFADMPLEPGLVIAFQDPTGEVPGVIQSVGSDRVTVDFNHPLAGKSLIFEVDILNIQDGT